MRTRGRSENRLIDLVTLLVSYQEKKGKIVYRFAMFALYLTADLQG